MKTILQQIAIVGLCISLYSCVSYDVSYIQAPTVQPKAQKVFLLVKDSLNPQNYYGQNNNAFIKTLAQTISEDLTKSKVNNLFKVHSNVYSLDTQDDINGLINNYDPDAIITVKREQSMLVRSKYSTYYNGGTYTITVVSAKTRKAYWKSIIEVANENYTQVSDYVDLAKQIVDKLKLDGII
jgi:hypothetical protein